MVLILMVHLYLFQYTLLIFNNTLQLFFYKIKFIQNISRHPFSPNKPVLPIVQSALSKKKKKKQEQNQKKCTAVSKYLSLRKERINKCSYLAPKH